MFSHLCVILFTEGGEGSAQPPSLPHRQTSWMQTSSGCRPSRYRPPDAHPPGCRPPQADLCLDADPPGCRPLPLGRPPCMQISLGRPPPPDSNPPPDTSASGWYAFSWNAFLLKTENISSEKIYIIVKFWDVDNTHRVRTLRIIWPMVFLLTFATKFTSYGFLKEQRITTVCI